MRPWAKIRGTVWPDPAAVDVVLQPGKDRRPWKHETNIGPPRDASEAPCSASQPDDALLVGGGRMPVSVAHGAARGCTGRAGSIARPARCPDDPRGGALSI